MDCRVHGAAKGQTRLSGFHFHLENENQQVRLKSENNIPYAQLIQ